MSSSNSACSDVYVCHPQNMTPLKWRVLDVKTSLLTISLSLVHNPASEWSESRRSETRQRIHLVICWNWACVHVAAAWRQVRLRIGKLRYNAHSHFPVSRSKPRLMMTRLYHIRRQVVTTTGNDI